MAAVRYGMRIQGCVGRHGLTRNGACLTVRSCEVRREAARPPGSFCLPSAAMLKCHLVDGGKRVKESLEHDNIDKRITQEGKAEFYRFPSGFCSEKGKTTHFCPNADKKPGARNLFRAPGDMGPAGLEPATNQLCLPLRLSPPLAGSWSGLSLHPRPALLRTELSASREDACRRVSTPSPHVKTGDAWFGITVPQMSKFGGLGFPEFDR